VVGIIVPWNYPLFLAVGPLVDALAAGNRVMVKMSEYTPRFSALFAEQVARHFAADEVAVVTGDADVAAAFAALPLDHLLFTGSTAVGHHVMRAASTNLTPVTLELGGKSPQVVFADAELDQALLFVVNAAIQNAGQTCSAGSRLLVEDSAYDEFIGMVAERFHTIDVGPAERDLDCGPLINPQQQERVEGFLAQAHRDRLLRLAEGKIAPNTPEGGFYVKPVLLGDVPPDHKLARDEIFGPVLVAIRFKDEEEAIRIANATPYGLVAGVWTRDGGRQLRLARAIRAGQVFVNNYGAGGGVELPFGGMKGSGFGREKGFEALYGFSTLKTIALRHG
jgi:aldehyde dehydrogenase (NAD+)